MDWKKKRFDVGELLALHKAIKGKAIDLDNNKRRCLYCKYYTESLKSNKKCKECLETKHLNNFKIDHFLKEDEKWQWLKE